MGIARVFGFGIVLTIAVGRHGTDTIQVFGKGTTIIGARPDIMGLEKGGTRRDQIDFTNRIHTHGSLSVDQAYSSSGSDSKEWKELHR